MIFLYPTRKGITQGVKKSLKKAFYINTKAYFSNKRKAYKMMVAIFGIFLLIVLIFIINPNITYRIIDIMELFLTCCVDILTNTVGLVLDLYTGIISRCQTIRKGWKLWKRGDITLRSIREYCWVRIRMYVMYLFDIGLKTYPQHYELEYYHGSKRYRIVFPKKRGTRSITQVLTSDNVDITKDVHEALGPANNFHGIPTTPRMLGYPSTEVEYIKMKYKDGSTREYRDIETILLTCENG